MFDVACSQSYGLTDLMMTIIFF